MMHSHYQFNARPLAFGDKKISAEARALIDQAIAAGRVTRVEQGVSGMPGYVYDPKQNQIVLRDPAVRAVRQSEMFRDGAVALNAKRREARIARQAQAVRLRDEGWSNDRIAEALGVNKRTVVDLLGRARREAETVAAAAGEGVK